MKQTLLKEEKLEIYAFQEENAFLLKQILSSSYDVLQEFKKDRRTYVAKISYEGQDYIFKKIYYHKKWKRFLSLWKEGEALTSIRNIFLAKQEGLVELGEILAVAKSRKRKHYHEYLLMPYYEGERKQNADSFMKIIEFLAKMHSCKRFHGDCNPNNFLMGKEQFYVIDTKAKKYIFGNYRAHYDILTWMKHKPSELKMEYPYTKNIFYYFAKCVRNIRNIKSKWKDLRDVGE